MPALAGLLGSAFMSIVAWLTTYVGKKVALALGAIIAIGSLTTIFFAAIGVAIYGMVQVIPGPARFMLSLLPPNLGAVFASILAIKVARWVYETNAKVVQLTLWS